MKAHSARKRISKRGLEAGSGEKMEIKEYQEKIRELIRNIDSKTGANHDSNLTIIHVMEEFGEVARQVFNEKSRRDKLNKENLSEEISDTIMLLVQLATTYGIDIEKAMAGKYDELRKRYNV